MSYIAVPAAMRLSVPQANPVFIYLSLAITFPFNISLGNTVILLFYKYNLWDKI